MKPLQLDAPQGGHLQPTKPSVIPLEINPKDKKTGLNMRIRVRIDGELVDDFMSDSFTFLFAQTLQAMMHGGQQERYVPAVATSYTNANEIVNVTPYDNSLMVEGKTNSSFNNAQPDDNIWIYEVAGLPAANGLFQIEEKISNSEVKIVNLDGTNITTTGSYDSGGFFGTTGLRMSGIKKNNIDRLYYGFPDWEVRIGTSNTAVHIRDFGLWQDGGGFSMTGTSFSAITTDKPSSRFTMVRSFTNSTSSDINIQEYAIVSRMDINREHEETIGISRDVRSSKVVPAGKTMSVELTPVIRLTPDTQDTATDGTNGGFLAPFMSRLRDIASQSYSYIRNNIYAVATPPGNASSMENNGVKSSDFGIVLGTDNKFTSMTDGGVLSRIQHGSGDGQLYHYGTDVRPMVIDDGNNQAYYDIVRLFGNEGSAAVTAKETAIMANVEESQEWGQPTAIARHALASADQITIQPGEIKPIVYRVTVTA